jgi:hypothetical protein
MSLYRSCACYGKRSTFRVTRRHFAFTFVGARGNEHTNGRMMLAAAKQFLSLRIKGIIALMEGDMWLKAVACIICWYHHRANRTHLTIIINNQRRRLINAFLYIRDSTTH